MESKFWNTCTLEQVKDILQEAINRFMVCDSNLLNLAYEGIDEDKKLHEVCIAHKLANHLEGVLQELSIVPERTTIDLEYNKHGLDVKRWGDGKAFRPDILLHERATDKQNYLALELKKDTNLGKNERNLKDDISKIERLCDPEGDYRYRFGFVLVVTSKEIQIRHSCQLSS